MPVTLAQAQVNTQDDVAYAIIDNLRRYSWVLDQMVFDDTVTPGTGGATLTYGYTRLSSARSASFRAYNSEYQRDKAERERVTVDLKPLGGAYAIDRTLANLGQAATNETAFQLQQLLTSIRIRFIEELINGDVASDEIGFDGLDTILSDADTEHTADEGMQDIRPSTINETSLAMAALDELDEWLSGIIPSTTGGGDLGTPGAVPPGVKALLGNTRMVSRIKALARWAGLYTESKDDVGRHVSMYGDWVLIDAGDNATGTESIISTGGSSGNSALYAVTFGMDALHGAAVAGSPLLQQWAPDYTTAGAVKAGEVEMGPVALAVKNTKSCGVMRDIRITG